MAASPRGDALIALTRLEKQRMQVRVMRRAPGGSFSSPVMLRSQRTSRIAGPHRGWGCPTPARRSSRSTCSRRTRTRRATCWVATAAAGARFRAPIRLATLDTGAPFALAVAPDGSALLAFQSGGRLRVVERAPAAGWGRAVTVATAGDGLVLLPAVALRAGGAAAIAWMGAFDFSVRARTRERPGGFGAPITLAAGKKGTLDASWLERPARFDEPTG